SGGGYRRKYHISLFTGRFSRHAVMHAVPASSYNAESTANILVYMYIPQWRVPKRLLSDKGSHFSGKLSAAVIDLLGAHRIFISSYHPSTNNNKLCELRFN
ncbi:unnamed protein product, partial [Sphacelaria rigidula]